MDGATCEVERCEEAPDELGMQKVVVGPLAAGTWGGATESDQLKSRQSTIFRRESDRRSSRVGAERT